MRERARGSEEKKEEKEKYGEKRAVRRNKKRQKERGRQGPPPLFYRVTCPTAVTTEKEREMAELGGSCATGGSPRRVR